MLLEKIVTVQLMQEHEYPVLNHYIVQAFLWKIYICLIV